MSFYKHILVAIDLSDDAGYVLEKAKNIAELNGARITMVHVVEPLSVAYGSDIPLNVTTLQAEITEHAKERISALAEKIKIDHGEQYIVYGRPEKEVHRIAETSDVDLIIVGTHGRHGLALILGSTSTSILHGSCCDVLAIRVNKN